MATAIDYPVSYPETFADLLEQLGGIPPERVMLRPPPGTATEQDVIAAMELPRKRLCELIDGVLVEKAMGTKEGMLGGIILQHIWNHLDEHDLGIALPGDSAMRLRIGLVRIPDVCFISWDRLPEGELPDEAISGVVPNLAVEVLSKSNTPREMERKLRDYFQAGVQAVWMLDPRTETAQVYTSPTKARKIGKDQALSGGKLLPGFSLPLKELFARGRRGKRKAR
jgi:Uma2 family endonuclease